MGDVSLNRNSYSRFIQCLSGLIPVFLIVGCSSLKKAAILGGVAATSAGVASALLNPVSTAAVVGTAVIATGLVQEATIEAIEMECAPDNL